MTREPIFSGLFAHTTISAGQPGTISLGELLDRYLVFIKETCSETTFTTYQTPARVIREVLGEKTLIHAITRADIQRFCDVLKKLPKNSQQRYPGLTAEQAIEAAAKKGDLDKLSPASLENYFTNVLALFNHAVEEKLINENPADCRLALRAPLARLVCKAAQICQKWNS